MTVIEGLRHTQPMIVAFFESIKYTGHFFPFAVFRLFLGYIYVQLAIGKVDDGYLDQPHLAGLINEWLPKSMAPGWYQMFLESAVVPYWQVFAYLIVGFETFIGVSFLVGFLVRPAAFLAAFLHLNYLMIGDPNQTVLNTVMLGMALILGWLGAGRCLGLDYFFFKRNRGIWW